MAIATDTRTATLATLRRRIDVGRIGWGAPLGMVAIRTLLFLAWQGAAAAILAVTGTADALDAAVAWWPVSIVGANLTTLAVLFWLLRREGGSYRELVRIDRHTIGRDLLVLLGVTLLAGVLASIPSALVSMALWGDPAAGSTMVFRPVPTWAATFALVAFPITIALSELPTYFGYAMPRLALLSQRWWLAILVSAGGLAVQHCALPFLPDWRFLIWRGLMYLPFALLLAIVIAWRPRLLPYLMVVHGLLDFAAAWMFFSLSVGAP